MHCKISGGKKRYGSVFECYYLSLLLGIMLKQKCEASKLFVFSSPELDGKSYCEVDVDTESIYEGLKRCRNIAK
jgi:hypothetical protein